MSNGICPYTGASLDDKGEIDHIIPRSVTTKIRGAIFNHEANLIYCSREGNQKKGNMTYGLESLHDKYLKAVFGTSDRKEINERIGLSLNDLKGTFVFSELPEHIQINIRHGLFCKDHYTEVLSLISSQDKAKVNGTQSYLIKKIIRELRQYLLENGYEPQFKIITVSAENVSKYRRYIATYFNHLKKQENQPVYSHIIDATCALWYSFYNEAMTFQSLSIESEPFSVEGASQFNQILPNEFIIQKTLKRDLNNRETAKAFGEIPIFKDGIYGEHFIPVVITKEGLHFGFNSENKIAIEANAELWLKTILPFLCKHDELKNTSLEQLQVAAGNRFLAFKFDKTKCLDLLQKAGKEPVFYNANMDIVTIIEGLRYVTQRKDISAVLLDGNKKKLQELKKDKFDINVTIIPARKDFGKTVKGRLILPVFREWIRVESKLLYEINKNNGKSLLQLINDVYNELYGNKELNIVGKTHKQYTRKISLPIVASPAGGFRLKRKNNENEPVFQLLATDEGYAWGFDNQLKEVIEHPILKNSTHVVNAGVYNTNTGNDIVRMDEWREISIPDEYISDFITMYLCPGTSPRFYARIIMRVNAFFDKLVTNDFKSEINSNVFNIPRVIKDTDYNKEYFCNAIKRPRDRICFASLKREFLPVELSG